MSSQSSPQISLDDINILHLPEMILEEILKFLPYQQMVCNVRPVCCSFNVIVDRILRMTFRNIGHLLNRSTKRLDVVSSNNMSSANAGYYIYKLVAVEFSMLRASCGRQIEDGVWSFVPWKTIEEYHRIIRMIEKEEICKMLNGISDILLRLNDQAYWFFDRKTLGVLDSGDVKLFGLEVIETLAAAFNASCHVMVTYDPTRQGSCYLIGRYTFNNCCIIKHQSSPQISLDDINILHLPEMILEEILKFLPYQQMVCNVRPVCCSFNVIVDRILRMTFRNIGHLLNRSTKRLDVVSSNNMSSANAGYYIYKLVAVEFSMLRASCGRQIEDGVWSFVPWKTIEEYHRIIRMIEKEEICKMLNGISDILLRLNDQAYWFFDRKTLGVLDSGDVKLFGLEVIETLAAAFNASCHVMVTYDPTRQGSCYLIGRYTFNNCCIIKHQVIEGYKEQLRLMRYLRSLVRANNSDTILNKIKDWNNTILTGVVSPIAQFGPSPWEVTERHYVLKDCVQEVHTRAAMDASDWCDPENVGTQMVFEFQLLCPKAAKPLGLKLLDFIGNTSGSDTPSRQDLRSDQNQIVDNLDDIPTSLGTLSPLDNTMIADIPLAGEKQTEDYSQVEFCRNILLKHNATSNQEMNHESKSTDTKLMKILLRQVQGYVSYVSTKLKIRNDQFKLTKSLYEKVQAHSIEDQNSRMNYSTEMCFENTLSTADRDIKNGHLPNLTQEMKSDSSQTVEDG
uniref:F-box domain-containing protein n=1 Tax=Timema poppense TaxID=170557 RepID=A0A7R9H808_TIMPO|nr:unnamed protein product [Timema poppensis]